MTNPNMRAYRSITQGKPFYANIMCKDSLEFRVTSYRELIRLIGDDGKFSNSGVKDARTQFSIYDSKRIYRELCAFPEDMNLFLQIAGFVRTQQLMNGLMTK